MILRFVFSNVLNHEILKNNFVEGITNVMFTAIVQLDIKFFLGGIKFFQLGGNVFLGGIKFLPRRD